MKYENKFTENKINRYIKFIIPIFLTLTGIFIFLSINEIYSVFKKEGYEKIITIPDKTSVINISKILKNEKIISTPILFQIYSRFKNYKNMKSGKFKLKTNMNYNDIIKTITNNENVIYDEKIIFYEGMDFFTLKEKYKDKLKNIKIEDLIEEINNEENFKEFPFIEEIGRESLKDTYYPMEGLIFPYTYPIKENSTAKSIAKDILNKSNEKILELKEKTKDSEMKLYDIFILASIIQAETSNVEEMRKVSGVFHNRMKIKKKLESDVTALYSKKIKNDSKNKNLTINLDLIKNYNTYQTKSLPSGPICTPSLKAIEAAIKPLNEGYYYFYADSKTGKIFYEKDFENHKKNYIKN